MEINTEAERILKAIQMHPEGIHLVDLGNALGVNWRTLIDPVGFLLEGGKVEKMDSIYYPVTG